MTNLVLVGPWYRLPQVLAALMERGRWATLAAEPELLEQVCTQRRPALLVAALDDARFVPALAATARKYAVPWLGCVLTSGESLIEEAYRQGALAVLPGNAGVPLLEQAVRNALDARTNGSATLGTMTGHRRFRQGENINLPEGSLVDVCQGIVSLGALLEDGSESLLGLFGPGRLLLAHPGAPMHLRLMAHTDCAVHVRAWREFASDTALAERLRERIQLAEAWAAMQARSPLDARLAHLLTLLSEQFGTRDADVTVVDVRLTHVQLASATGASRATVSRALAALRRKGVVTTRGSGATERFCLVHDKADGPQRAQLG